MRVSEPSDRNYALFLDVQFNGLSLRAAATKYEISTARVQQILAQTRAWYRDSTPEWVLNIDPRLQPLVACRLMEERLEHQYSQAMTAWSDSQGRKSVEREGVHSHTKTVTTRDHHGEVRYLAQAGRTCQAIFDANLRTSKTVHELPAEVREALSAAHTDTAVLEEHTAPPEEGCAPAATLPPQMTHVLAEARALNTIESSGCELGQYEETQIASSVLDFPNPVRTRKERKRRQRELARAKQRGMAG